MSSFRDSSLVGSYGRLDDPAVIDAKYWLMLASCLIFPLMHNSAIAAQSPKRFKYWSFIVLGFAIAFGVCQMVSLIKGSGLNYSAPENPIDKNSLSNN